MICVKEQTLKHMVKNLIVNLLKKGIYQNIKYALPHKAP